MTDLFVVLVRPRFPENIGMVARAMSNFGLNRLCLVRPERFDLDKARPLATAQGSTILENVEIHDSFPESIKAARTVIGTTARTGGWRQALLTPEKAAREARQTIRDKGKTALVFGPEDRGLGNEEVERCTHLVTIPTIARHSSLNLAQAALLLFYECARAHLELGFLSGPGASKRDWALPSHKSDSRRITVSEEDLLFSSLESTLLHIGHLDAANPSWFMQPMRKFLRRSKLRRHEMDMLMGICRQIGQMKRE